MSDVTLPDYDDFDFLLQNNKLPCSASEVHGILCGSICGGMSEASREWLSIVRDFCLDGESVPEDVVSAMINLYKATFEQLKDGQLAFQIYLPEDDVSLTERAETLIEWLNGFLSSIGVQSVNLQAADEEIREAFQDLVAISKMDTELEETEENFQSFEEIVEYIRITAILCFGEFGDALPEDLPNKPTLH
ncbi:hypothetical protein C2869_19135 [Saccharobesus litoralis]|uniref:YecA family protein n=1 Tax=Saccharobesus litoralis TaxID=2172099 RepID=A0A2S0VVZ5_9ALTE|nr:UPF0149 family protein [Saccharobesus litoralis]AWB68389.1 hypothetical protein C2869_19135 [Saccharobesus litoralis]